MTGLDPPEGSGDWPMPNLPQWRCAIRQRSRHRLGPHSWQGPWRRCLADKHPLRTERWRHRRQDCVHTERQTLPASSLIPNHGIPCVAGEPRRAPAPTVLRVGLTVQPYSEALRNQRPFPVPSDRDRGSAGGDMRLPLRATIVPTSMGRLLIQDRFDRGATLQLRIMEGRSFGSPIREPERKRALGWRSVR